MAQLVRINYHDWPNCYRLSNDEVELVITTDVGPRIIRFAFGGEANEFYEDPEAIGQIGGDMWQLYGGHRLWHAPEMDGLTNAPDNKPVKFEQHDDFVSLIQSPVSEAFPVQKEMDIVLVDNAAQVRIVHRLRNIGASPLRLAPWSLSVMASGGRAIIPLPPSGTHPEDLLPTGALILWAYADMSDPRWTWGRQYILLQQDSRSPQKIGCASAEGWLAYVNRGHLFVKTHDYVPGAVYPDKGSSVEVFTNQAMLELETLGPMVTLEPGTTVEHVENWFLFRDVPEPLADEDVNQFILPKVKKALEYKA
jgi:hypothetical protein